MMAETFNHGYALLIGVGESQYTKLSLPVTIKDTQAIYGVLTDRDLCGYPPEQIRVLNNAEATRDGILQGLSWLKGKVESDREATVIVYYSGHGWVDKADNRYYLLQYDVKPSKLTESALSAEVFTSAIREIKAERLLVVIDSCHAAGMATSKDADAELMDEFDGFERVAFSKGLIDDLKRGKGRVVFTSSEGHQKSWILEDRSLSIYTFHFLEALRGAGNNPSDTEVWASNIMNYLGKAVPVTARQLYNVEQIPQNDITGGDFAIALLRGGKGLPEKGLDDVKSEDGQKVNKISDKIVQKGKFITNINEAQGLHIGDNFYDGDRTSHKSVMQNGLENVQVEVGKDFNVHISQSIINRSDTNNNILSQFQSLITDKTEGFVGREYVFDAIKSFITNNPKGYFTIIGDPGQGKSAILAKYVRDTECIAHFNILLQGPNRADQFLESICNQLINRYQLPYESLPLNATRDGEFLGQLLDEAAQNRNNHPIVIAVDALDEVDLASHRDAANILYLPPHLPNGVYFILTRRRGVEVSPTVYTPSQLLNLLDYQIDSERDVRTYIQNRVNSSEQLRLHIAERDETVADFTDKISEKSEANFMYLRYVLLDIENGEYSDLTLEQFPQGLQSYYEFHWRRMGMNNDPLPLEKIRIVVILGAVKEPVSQRKVCDYSREEPFIVQNILFKWKQFLHELIKDDEKRYSIYHSSYRDFLYSLTKDNYPITFQEIHARIAKVELKVWNKFKEVLKNRRHE